MAPDVELDHMLARSQSTTRHNQTQEIAILFVSIIIFVTMPTKPLPSSVIKKAPPPLYVEYSSLPTRLRVMECSTEARFVESLFLITDSARDDYIQQL
ncbi:hypothetical protein BGZ65_008409, partial [Modicella reniformis]